MLCYGRALTILSADAKSGPNVEVLAGIVYGDFPWKKYQHCQPRHAVCFLLVSLALGRPE